MIPPFDLARLLSRIEEEYREFPGLRLTQRQMQRLWDLDRDTCAIVVEVLVARQILVKTDDEIFTSPQTARSWRGSRGRRAEDRLSTGSRGLVVQDGIKL